MDMNTNKTVGILIAVACVLLIAAISFMVGSYTSSSLGAIITFTGSADYTKLQQCGVTSPELFNKIRNDFTFILPFIYVGVPIFLLVIAALMFLSGKLYQKGKAEEEKQKAGMQGPR